LRDDWWVNGPNTSWAQAAAAALNNGTDLECAQHNQGKLFNVMHLYLNQSWAEGLVTMKRWDEALARWFEKLFLLGVFDKEVSYRSLGAKDINTPAAQALALRAARESIILLQNNEMKSGAKLLPLPKAPGTDRAAGQRFARDAERLHRLQQPRGESDAVLSDISQGAAARRNGDRQHGLRRAVVRCFENFGGGRYLQSR